MAGIAITVFSLPEEKAKGLQFMKPVPPRHLFVFADIAPGTIFHTRNVTEPIDIMFVSLGGEVLDMVTIVPPRGTIQAPPGTGLAVEAKEGELSRLDMDSGRNVSVSKLLGTPKIASAPEEPIAPLREGEVRKVILKKNFPPEGGAARGMGRYDPNEGPTRETGKYDPNEGPTQETGKYNPNEGPDAGDIDEDEGPDEEGA
jgi:uncharacterized membrane protein (UPF0127 family)